MLKLSSTVHPWLPEVGKTESSSRSAFNNEDFPRFEVCVVYFRPKIAGQVVIYIMWMPGVHAGVLPISGELDLLMFVRNNDYKDRNQKNSDKRLTIGRSVSRTSHPDSDQ